LQQRNTFTRKASFLFPNKVKALKDNQMSPVLYTTNFLLTEASEWACRIDCR